MQFRDIVIAVVAIVAVLIGLFASRIAGGFRSPEPGGVSVAYATTTVVCGRTAWEISTGTDSGFCGAEDATTDFCKDNEGNETSVDCSGNKGQGECGAVTGAASCKLSDTQPFQ